MPDLTLDPHASEKHTQILKDLAQQRRSRLRTRVSVQSGLRGHLVEAEAYYHKRKANRHKNRNQDTPNNAQGKSKRWMTYETIDDGFLIEKQDELDGLFDMATPVNRNMVSGLNRDVDEVIIEAAFGSALSGQKGTTSSPWPADQVVPKGEGGPDTGMNVAKLRAAKKLFIKNQVVGEEEGFPELYMTLSAENHDSLLADIQATSKDFNSAPVLENGYIMHFMGFMFVLHEGTPHDTATNTRSELAWHKDGITLGEWQGIQSKLAERPDKSFNVQLYVSTRVGAVRNQDTHVAKVETHELAA